ncbi:MAG: hypothetical protein Q8M94_00045, partial [Ignavibacteria bacterium]|nr:hypothetical protein [Ignavibacteria bacterium]
MKKITFIVLTVLMLFAISIQAQTIPNTINYQGVLKDGSGVVVANGNYNITFKFYDVETSGTELWTETNVVSVVDGMINTQIGSVTPLNLPFDVQYWLGITVEAGSELSPRIKLTSAPYSLMSQNVINESITTSKLQNGSVTTDKISDGTITANDIGDNQLIKKVNGIRDSVNLVAGSNVSITPSGNTLTISSSGGTGGGDITAVYAGTGLTGGGTTGDVTLSVANDGITNTMLQNNSVNSSKINDGTINAVDIGSSQIVKSVNTLKDNVGIIGGSNINIGASGNDIIISSTAGGLTLPFNGTLNTSNTAALNISHTSTTGTNYGLYTTINSISGAAVYGLGTTMGVSGIANATDGLTRGIFGESHSTAGYGVWGAATSNTGTNYGVYGRSYSNGGYGL